MKTMNNKILTALGFILMIFGALLIFFSGCSADVPTLPTLYFVDDGGTDQSRR